ncbi:MAG: ABC transporter permease [Parafilimonas terrae]|jgi:peptide/nickel transport system permease protein|nr:ABC transporter permease [Parafilimonas terrae]
MLRYIAERILLMIPTLFGVAVLIFFMLRVVPGDIVEIKLRSEGGQVTQAQIETERTRLGLDKPLMTQLGTWLVGIPTLHLGESMWTGRPVTEEIATRLPVTFQAALMAAIIATLIAIPLGTLSALYRNTWIDYALRIVTTAGLAVPGFWLGMVVILLLLRFFDWIPPVTYTSFFKDPVANLSQMIWPALVVGFRYAAVVSRMVRSSVVEVLREDYIRTARAKGVPEKRVVVRHAIRNALLPAVTVIGLEFAFLMGGLVVTEQVFNLNGIGQLFVQAVTNRDFLIVQNLVLLLAFLFIFINFVVDVLYALLDPRIRYR